MRTRDLPFSDYVVGPNPLVIPKYQRPYEWKQDRWTDLWRDVSSLYRRSEAKDPERRALNGPPHFMGTLIAQVGEFIGGGAGNQLLVVDGQQRLVSLFLLESARRDHAAYLAGSAVDPFPLARLIDGSDRLTPNDTDGPAFRAAMTGLFRDQVPAEHVPSGVASAYRFFRYQFWLGRTAIASFKVASPPRPPRRRGSAPTGTYEAWGEPARDNEAIDLPRVEMLLRVGLVFLQVALETSDEDAGVVFETINGKTTPMMQFDHLRNSIFIRMPHRREEFLSKYWADAERTLHAVSYRSLRQPPEEQFFYEYLISLGEEGAVEESGTKFNTKILHRLFMERVIRGIGYDVTDRSEESFERDFALPLAVSARLYALAVGFQSDATISGRHFQLRDDAAQLINEIMQMSGGPAVPLQLRYIKALFDGEISDEELNALLLSIQSYLVRLMMVGQPYSPLRARFRAVAGAVADNSLASLRAALAQYGWPTDDELRATAPTTQLTAAHSGPEVFPILRGLERQAAGGGAHSLPYGAGPDEYSIEHIFPQGNRINRAWEADCKRWGNMAARNRMNDVRHTLGNLTAVTNYNNQRNATRAFAEKKKLIVDSAPLRLHETITAKGKWTSQEITERSRTLVDLAIQRWPGPPTA